jgi:hypothetical protein
MARVDRPSIVANVARKSLELFELFRANVTRLAKPLDLAMPELERVAAVRLDMVERGPGAMHPAR